MKKYITKTKTIQRFQVWRTVCLIAFLSFMGVQNANAQYTAIPDPNFEQALIGYGIDDFPDGQVLTANISSLLQLSVGSYNIQSLAGIEDFTSLEYLFCPNNQLTSLNLSSLTNLYELDCSQNQITTLDLTGVPSLFDLKCGNNQLTSLIVSGMPVLYRLNCDDNQLSSIDLSGLNQLNEFSIRNNQLTSINISVVNNLRRLDCSGNQLSSLNLSGSSDLSYLNCNGNQLTALNLSGMNLSYLTCNNNQLTSLNVSTMPNLGILSCNWNQITALDLSGLNLLNTIECGNNMMTSLNLNGLTSLRTLYCSFNLLPAINLNGLINLRYLYCRNNRFTSLNLTSLINLSRMLCDLNNCLTCIRVDNLAAAYANIYWTKDGFASYSNVSCPNITPTFTAVAPICLGETLLPLPTTSTDGITGTWSPALNNTTTTTYTFEPITGQCAPSTTLTITVNPSITPNFTAVAPICSGANLTALPSTSTNGITGTWSPVLNNLATTIYTFTPATGQCAVTTLLTITVNPCVTPTSLQPAFCGTTLATLATKIGTIPVYGATGYRFEITTGGVTTIYDSYSYNFSLRDAGVAAYGTTYTIRVAALINGVYGNYGAPCTVTTPTLTSNVVPTTALLSTVCNTTLAALNTKIGASTVFGATGYRFEITTGGLTTIYDSIGYNFRLSDAGVAAYGTTYTIRVAALINGVYGNYGAPCTVTTPTLTSNVVPTTSLQPAFCGTTLVAMAVKIGTIPINGATGYRFEITTGGVTTIYDSATYNFTLIQAGVAVYGATYTIRVAALINGVYGNYGAPCTVTTPTLTTSVVPTTALLPAFCGTTLAALAVKIGTIPVYGATGYRFEITTGGVTTIYDSATYNFTLIQAGVAAYGTTYTIRVAALVGGIYGNYGAPCTVTTLPASTQIETSFCGSTLNAMNSNITAYPLFGATAYRFEVVNGVSVRTYVSNTNSFNLTQLTGVTKYGIPYTIRVAAEINGSWIAYGSSCTITTPTPITEIQTSQCGITLSNLNTTIFATALPFITSYTFEVSDGVSVRTFVASTNSFNLTQLVGGANYATSYTIRVSAFYGGSWRPYGNSCTITTPIQVLRLKAKTFEVSAYPNPFETAFNLNLETPSKSAVTVTVYDMLGRQVETKTIIAEDLATTTLGSNYATGVYNIIISQDENVKTLRMVKN